MLFLFNQSYLAISHEIATANGLVSLEGDAAINIEGYTLIDLEAMAMIGLVTAFSGDAEAATVVLEQMKLVKRLASEAVAIETTDPDPANAIRDAIAANTPVATEAVQ